MNFIHSIKFRFTLWYLLVLSILLVMLSSGVYFYLSHTLHQNLDDELERRATQLSDFRDIVPIIAEGRFEEEIGEVIIFYFHSGSELTHISHRDTNLPLRVELVEKAIAGQSLFETVKTSHGAEIRIYAIPFSSVEPYIMLREPIKAGEPTERIRVRPEALVVGRPTNDIEQALNGLFQTLLVAVPLTLVIAGGGGVFLARRAFIPVDQMTQTARDIEETDLSQRIKVYTKDELGRLATTLNQMIERLEKAFKRQQQFTGDASHELRAPLAVIQAESTLALQKQRNEMDYRRSLEAISQEAGHMARIIDQLLTLARADAGKDEFSFEEINLGELLGELSTDVEVLCQDKGLKFQLDQLESLIVRGDRARLRQLFLNILDNAIRYTPSDGIITASLHREGQMAVVSIADTGIGIPPEDLPHVFERFYRVDKARSRAEGGSGLGLAISRHISEVHGGKIEVESQFRIGSTFSVWLPLES
jgi:heavy metal sensor kinase